MIQDRLSIQEMIELDLSYDEFRSMATIRFDYRFGEWRVIVRDLDNYHFFTPWRSPGYGEELWLKSAFERFQLIMAHGGTINIHGVFLKDENIEVYRKKFEHVSYSLAYSKILDRWFASYGWFLKNGGASCSPSLSGQAYRTRQEAVDAVKAFLAKQLEEFPVVLKLLQKNEEKQPSLFDLLAA